MNEKLIQFRVQLQESLPSMERWDSVVTQRQKV
jgi:hypothetical protein